jgi:hypothetical protein
VTVSPGQRGVGSAETGMVTGGDTCATEGVSLGACCASFLVTATTSLLSCDKVTSHRNHGNKRGPFLAYSGPTRKRGIRGHPPGLMISS